MEHDPSMNRLHKSRRQLLTQLLISFFLMVVAGWLTIEALLFRMGCGWTGTCGRYGGITLIALSVLTIAAFCFFLKALFRLLVFAQPMEK